MLAAFKKLAATAPSIGLQLNLGKCELITTMRDNPLDLSSFPQEIKRNHQACFDILGGVIGDASFTKTYLREKRLLSCKERLDALEGLDDGHASYKILSSCLGSCRMMYAMRTTPSNWAQDVFSEFDSVLRSSFESVVGRPVSHQAWKQAALSSSKGGLGFRTAADHAPAAYYTSICQTASLCKEIDPAYTWHEGANNAPLTETISLLNSRLPADGQVVLEQSPSDDSATSQKDLSAKIDNKIFDALYATGNLSDKTRLMAASAPHAGAWLTAPATRALDNRLSTAEFAAASLLRIGANQTPADTWCPKCDCILERSALHAVSCSAGGDRTIKHNTIRDETHHHCVAAGLHSTREVSGLLPDDPRRRPGDIVIQGDDTTLALDFAVTSPFQPSVREDASKSHLAAAIAYEAEKYSDRDTSQRCEAEGMRLVPMVVECLGGWGPAAQGFFKTLVKAACAKTGVSESVATTHLYQNLGIKLQRANARSILSRVGAFTADTCTTQAATSSSEAALVQAAAAAEHWL